VSLFAATLDVTGPGVSKLPRHLRFHYTGGHGFTVLSLVKSARRGSGMRYTLLDVILNSGGGRALAARADGFPSIHIESIDNIFGFSVGGVKIEKVTIVSNRTGKVISSTVHVYLHYSLHDLFGSNVDESPADAAQTKGTLKDLFDLSGNDEQQFDNAWGGGKSDPNLDTGHYDDGHAFGWKKKHSTPSWWENVVKMLNDLAAKPVYQAAGVEDPVQSQPTPVPPPPKLYQFSVGTLKMTWTSNSKQPVDGSFTVDSATTCGSDPTKAEWTTTQHASTSNDSIHHVKAYFSTLNPSQIYSADVSAGGVEADLKFSLGTTSFMSLVPVTTGDVYSVSLTPAQEPVTVTPVKSCP
jgi:hypothetical protein